MPTLTQYRQRAAPEFGTFWSSTATSGSTVSVLEDTSWPVMSTLSQEDLYKDIFLLRPPASAADRVRIVSVYAPSTGKFTPDKSWAVAPAAGEAYEIHGMVEPWTAMNRLINNVLQRILIPTEFSFTPTAEYTRHTLASQAWLANTHWVRQVGLLTTSEDRNKLNPYRRVIRGECIKIGGTVYLDHPGHTFSSNDVVYVLAAKPAYDHCKATGGTFGDQSGLAAETDEAVPDEELVAAGVLVEGWKSFGHLLEPQANARLLRDRAEAARWFSELMAKTTLIPELTFRRLEWWGPLP